MKLCSYGNCQEKLQGYGRSLCNEHYKLVNPKASRSYPKLHVGPLATYFEAHCGELDRYRRNKLKEVFKHLSIKGEVNVHQADQILVRDFGVHPSLVYGEQWWSA